MLAELMEGCGILEYPKFVHNLPKIEFGDLIKLEVIIMKKPDVAQDIVMAMIRYTGMAFYNYVLEIMRRQEILPKPVKGHYVGSDGQHIIN